MDAKHFDLVAWSLARVKAMADAPARLFLARLEELDPTLLDLFGGNDRRARARVGLIAAAGFQDSQARAALRAMAQRFRHRPLGLRDQAVLLAAALWTLRRTLGAGFTQADREAWIAYHEQLVRVLASPAPILRRCER
jgi:hypothetical protein